MKTYRYLTCVLVIFAALLAVGPARACVGRILYIGSLNTAEDKLLAEMLVLLINERTGTTVKIRLFDTNDQLYQALKADSEEERVDIIVEDTSDADKILARQPAGDPEQDYLAIKARYEKELNIIWLNPFGFTNMPGKKGAISAPLVRRDVLTNFPLLPRVLNKLAGAIDNDTYQEMTGDVRGGSKPRNVAKNFLRERKFI